MVTRKVEAAAALAIKLAVGAEGGQVVALVGGERRLGRVRFGPALGRRDEGRAVAQRGGDSDRLVRAAEDGP